jgi:hypothetical protein
MGAEPKEGSLLGSRGRPPEAPALGKPKQSADTRGLIKVGSLHVIMRSRFAQRKWSCSSLLPDPGVIPRAVCHDSHSLIDPILTEQILPSRVGASGSATESRENRVFFPLGDRPSWARSRLFARSGACDGKRSRSSPPRSAPSPPRRHPRHRHPPRPPTPTPSSPSTRGCVMITVLQPSFSHTSINCTLLVPVP